MERLPVARQVSGDPGGGVCFGTVIDFFGRAKDPHLLGQVRDLCFPWKCGSDLDRSSEKKGFELMQREVGEEPVGSKVFTESFFQMSDPVIARAGR